MKKTKKAVAVAAVICLILTAGAGVAYSSKWGDRLRDLAKGAGIAMLTVALSDQLNDFINTVTLNKGVPDQAGTKVVPIISLGSGMRVGAAQVTGPKDLVAKVVVVVQLETKFSFKNLDVEIFVPSDSENPTKFNRVEGVGVSALIDLRLSGI